MSHVNVLERQKGRKEIGRINHSEKLTSSARQSSEIQWEAENQRDEGILAIWKDVRNPIKGPRLCRVGAVPTERLLLTTTVKHNVYDWKASSTQRDKGEADSNTYCRE